MRWIGKELDEGVALILEGMVIFRSQEGKKTRKLTHRGGCGVDLAGGVGTLSYEHHNISEPAILYVTSSFRSFLSQVFFSFLYLTYPLSNIRFLRCKLITYYLFLTKNDRLGGSFAVE